MLTSALYMDAKWATPFDAGKTQPGTFTPAGAKPVTVPFLNGAGFPLRGGRRLAGGVAAVPGRNADHDGAAAAGRVGGLRAARPGRP